jgi:hypothetical protein
MVTARTVAGMGHTAGPVRAGVAAPEAREVPAEPTHGIARVAAAKGVADPSRQTGPTLHCAPRGRPHVMKKATRRIYD